jgi:hypothetical protein
MSRVASNLITSETTDRYLQAAEVWFAWIVSRRTAIITGKFDPLCFAGPGLEGAHRQAMIAQAAYLRAEHRGFEPGHELEDWVSAEQEINRLVAGMKADSPQASS